MEGRVPRPEDPSKENGARNEKASRLSRGKHNQSKKTKTSRERERQHSFEIPPPLFSSLISAASSSRQPSPPQQGGIRAAVPVPFRPLSSRGKTLLKSLPLHFSWEFLMVFWVKSWVFREGGWRGALRISETTLPERFECGKVDGSEGV